MIQFITGICSITPPREQQRRFDNLLVRIFDSMPEFQKRSIPSERGVPFWLTLRIASFFRGLLVSINTVTLIARAHHIMIDDCLNASKVKEKNEYILAFYGIYLSTSSSSSGPILAAQLSHSKYILCRCSLVTTR